jgi:hypothetical protein
MSPHPSSLSLLLLDGEWRSSHYFITKATKVLFDSTPYYLPTSSISISSFRSVLQTSPLLFLLSIELTLLTSPHSNKE